MQRAERLEFPFRPSCFTAENAESAEKFISKFMGRGCTRIFADHP
jgi:hypothetical protein